MSIDRRTMLKGVGVAMALPWLESIPVWGCAPAAGSAAPAFPKRLATLFMGNGINPNHWWEQLFQHSLFFRSQQYVLLSLPPRSYADSFVLLRFSRSAFVHDRLRSRR